MHNAFQHTNWNALLRSPMQRVVRKKNRGRDGLITRMRIYDPPSRLFFRNQAKQYLQSETCT